MNRDVAKKSKILTEAIHQTITCEVIAASRDLFDSRPEAEQNFL